MKPSGADPQLYRSLSDAEERLRFALEASLSGYWDLDLTDQSARRSPRHAQIFGYDSADAPWSFGRFVEHVIPEDREFVKAAIAEVLEKNTDLNFECRIRRVDGAERWIWVSGRLRSDIRGNRRWLAGIVQDITERKQADQKLQQLNRTHRALSNATHAILGATDEIRYLEAVCRIIVEDCGHTMVWIGYKEDDERKSVRPVASAGTEEGYLESLHVSWADIERGRGPTGTAIRTGNISLCKDILQDPAFAPWRREAIKRGYGSSVVFPLISQGVVFGALTIYSKSANAFSEPELELLSELSKRLAFGITTIHNEAERKKLELELREALGARDEFLSIASHELKNPLTSLRLQLQLLLRLVRQYPSEQSERIITMAVRAASAEQQLAKLVEELLDITRIKGGQLVIERQPTDLTARVIEIVSRLSEEAIRSGSTIDVSFDGPITGFWDPGRLDQVVINLLSNAIKYGGGKPIHVRISADMDAEAAVLKISDSGMGIPLELQHKIFHRFERAVRGTKITGLGLGLYIAQQIVRAHGGSIGVESAPGQGSVFTVRLPLKN